MTAVAMHLQPRFIDIWMLLPSLIWLAASVTFSDGVIDLLRAGLAALDRWVADKGAKEIVLDDGEWMDWDEDRLAALDDAVPGLAKVRHHIVGGDVAAAREELERILDGLDSGWRQFA